MLANVSYTNILNKIIMFLYWPLKHNRNTLLVAVVIVHILFVYNVCMLSVDLLRCSHVRDTFVLRGSFSRLSMAKAPALFSCRVHAACQCRRALENKGCKMRSLQCVSPSALVWLTSKPLSGARH